MRLNSRSRRTGSHATMITMVLLLTCVLLFAPTACDGPFDGTTDDRPDTGGSQNGDDAGDGDGGTSDTVAGLFPMSLDAVWVYAVRVDSQDAWGWSPESTVDVGVITVQIVDLDPATRTGRIEVTGNHDVTSFIKEQYYIRWTEDCVEIASEAEGPWDATLDVSGEPWTGRFLLVRTVTNPQTSVRMTMSAQDTSIGTANGDRDVVAVSADYSNATQQYATEVYTIRSHQYFAADQPIGLVRCTSFWWYQLKNYQYGLGYSIEEVTIELVGYEIPQPDGSVLSGGDLNFSYAPSPPESLSVTSVSATTASLSWSSTSDIESGFVIERRTGPTGTWQEVAEVGAGVSSYTDSSLVAENEYYYRVRALNAAGVSEPSNEAYRAPALPPLAPSNLSAVVSQSGSFFDVTLTWVDNSDDESGFRLDRLRCGFIGDLCIGTWSENWSEVGSNVVSYLDRNVMSGDTYQYRVRAFNEFGDSAYSNVVEAVIP